MVFLYITSTPQGFSPKLHSFWRGPYKIRQVVSGMTYKIFEIEMKKELIVHYNCMKRCGSPLGGFLLPTNTPFAAIPPPNEILFKISFLFLRSPKNLYSNSWPKSCVLFGPISSSITAHHFCVATSCQLQPSRVYCAPGARNISKSFT